MIAASWSNSRRRSRPALPLEEIRVISEARCMNFGSHCIQGRTCTMLHPRSLNQLSPQIVLDRLGHAHSDKAAERCRAPGEHLAIDFRRVAERTPDDER